MIVFRSPEEVPADFGRTVVAIGKFDGVHLGHQAVIRRMKQDAAASGARTVAVTFDRNPLAVVRPEICPENVVDVERKIALLEEQGLDATLLLTFDAELAARTAEDFVTDILVGALRVSTVLVGADFRFGRGGAGTPDLLRTLGKVHDFNVDTVGEVFLADSGRRVSSTWVRELLDAGDVRGAARVLGRPVTVAGDVVHGAKRGRELGFPTANLAERVDSFVPADGVYAGWLLDGETRHPAAISVGTNPTFDDVPRRQVEAHVIGAVDLDLYGHGVTIEFTDRLRGMTAFAGIDALIAQIDADVAAARGVLGLVGERDGRDSVDEVR